MSNIYHGNHGVYHEVEGVEVRINKGSVEISDDIDISDAYLASGHDEEGNELTDEELDWLAQNTDWIDELFQGLMERRADALYDDWKYQD